SFAVLPGRGWGYEARTLQRRYEMVKRWHEGHRGAWLLLVLGAVAACATGDGPEKELYTAPVTAEGATEFGQDSDTASPPPAGKTLVFDAPFTDTSQWTVGRTSSYPGATNPNDNKLDYLSPSNGPDADGTFRATRRSDGNWDADLVTTEYSAKHFELKPGDEL